MLKRWMAAVGLTAMVATGVWAATQETTPPEAPQPPAKTCPMMTEAGCPMMGGDQEMPHGERMRGKMDHDTHQGMSHGSMNH